MIFKSSTWISGKTSSAKCDKLPMEAWFSKSSWTYYVSSKSSSEDIGIFACAAAQTSYFIYLISYKGIFCVYLIVLSTISCKIFSHPLFVSTETFIFSKYLLCLLVSICYFIPLKWYIFHRKLYKWAHHVNSNNCL